mmetsp:Transcript_45730/g.106157  ORF Transcript_45730/g.106157 Transcript_45730/m.106157 type:complete len:1040 (+) Transcript_45730:117-3236(+)
MTAPISKAYARSLLEHPDQLAQLSRWYFRTFDTNGDGELQMEEINRVLLQLFEDLSLHPPTSLEVDKWAKEFDVSQTGTFSPKEFQRFFQSTLLMVVQEYGEVGQAMDVSSAPSTPPRSPRLPARPAGAQNTTGSTPMGRRMRYIGNQPLWLLPAATAPTSGMSTDKVAEDSPGLITVGEEVMVLGNKGTYTRVRTEGGTVGWVPSANLQDLAPAAPNEGLSGGHGFAVGDMVQVKAASGDWDDTQIKGLNPDGTYDTSAKASVYPMHLRAQKSTAPAAKVDVGAGVAGEASADRLLDWALQALLNVRLVDPAVFARALDVDGEEMLAPQVGGSASPRTDPSRRATRRLSIGAADLAAAAGSTFDAATLQRSLERLGPGLMTAPEDLKRAVFGLGPEELLHVLQELGLEEHQVPHARGELAVKARLQEIRAEVFDSLKVALPTKDLRRATDRAATERLKAFLAHRGVSNASGRILKGDDDTWASVWVRLRLQYPTGREALVPDRSSKRVLVIGPGFGLLATPQIYQMVHSAGYQTRVVTELPDPQDMSTADVAVHLPILQREAEMFNPHVIIAASKGYVYLQQLWRKGIRNTPLTTPSLMINVHPSIKELPKNAPVILTQGSKDETFPQIKECVAVPIWTEQALSVLSQNVAFKPFRYAGDCPGLTVTRSIALRESRGGRLHETVVPDGAVLFSHAVLKAANGDIYVPMQTKEDLDALRVPATVFYRHGREDLERLIDTGAPGKAFLYLSNSGFQFQKGQFMITREGDNHAAPASLMQHDLLPRLLDAVMSGRPEEYLHETWLDLLSPARREGEAFLGYDPTGLMRFWTSDGTGTLGGPRKWRAAVRTGTEEFHAVEKIFRANPPDKNYNYGNDWSQARVIGVDRVENRGQLMGVENYYERVKNSLTKQGIDFVNGVHTRWLFHGSTAVDSIVSDDISGFKPLMSSAALWGRGIYFARDAQYPDDHRIVRIDERGVREVLLCLAVTGMAVLGDPSYRMPPQRRQTSHRYNSYVDSLSDPEIFVVNEAVSAIPHYVVRYM